MSDVVKHNSFLTHYYGATVPYGNMSILSYRLETNDTGMLLESNSTDPLAADDVIDIGVLPEGFLLADAQVFVMEAMPTGVTAKLGFKYEDGEDREDVPQNDEHFIAAGADLATVGRLRANGSNLVILPKPARLILTIAGAAVDQASKIRIAITGELTGSK